MHISTAPKRKLIEQNIEAISYDVHHFWTQMLFLTVVFAVYDMMRDMTYLAFWLGIS